MSEDFSLMQEIDDALRADKAHRFWLRYGKIIMAGCAAIIVATAISAYMKHRQHEANLAETHQMLQAYSLAGNGDYAGALKGLAPDSAAWKGERAASVKLQAVEIYLKDNQRDKAVATLKEIIALKDANEAVHDSAVLRLYTLTGEGDLTAAAQAGRPFSALALEMKAAGLLKAGKNKEAAEALKTILATANPYSPEYSGAAELLPLTGEAAQ